MESNIVTRAAKLAGNKSVLARLVGVTPQAVQQWEASGYVPPNSIEAVAKETGIPEAEFFAAYRQRPKKAA
ncbi:YdaS family helix-turn-helix protein [Aquitalea magnusonii]|uniref:YdaS antitoxin of YdaST toxin-antitoxin system n=1 Tax=Aquitalea magnusonii TaxID=332411 RepID=A0A318J6J4_9NEIS|nr:YdaS family helix-turn-helix protein [Aquitalea magnusonii]PXX42238.1 YdaS antitoxin of YdaST toxin-antitoxin system [Aquitalea magnusonii]